MKLANTSQSIYILYCKHSLSSKTISGFNIYDDIGYQIIVTQYYLHRDHSIILTVLKRQSTRMYNDLFTRILFQNENPNGI